MKTWQKIAVALALGVALFSVSGILVLLSVLPDPTNVGRSFSSRGEPRVERAPLAALTSPTPASTANFTQASKTAPVTIVAAPEKRDGAKDSAEREKLVTEAFMARYLGNDRIQSRVCENLEASPAPFKSSKEFGNQIERSLLGESPPSAAAEAVMLPVEYTLKNEAVRELVQSAQEAAARGNTGFLQKAQFYALAARATASVLSSRDKLENISANAYRLYALSRAAALKPEILQDPDMTDLCRGFERSAIDDIARDDTYDRDRMARLLERHKVSNETIGYNPDAATGVRIVNDGSNFQLKLQWLQEVFKE